MQKFWHNTTKIHNDSLLFFSIFFMQSQNREKVGQYIYICHALC